MKNTDISSKTRRTVNARAEIDGCPCCENCFKPGSHLHHIYFRSEGGYGNEKNLICLCIPCHNLAHKDKKPMQEKFLKKMHEIYGDFEKSEVCYDAD